jgi:hypothetical protein
MKKRKKDASFIDPEIVRKRTDQVLTGDEGKKPIFQREMLKK